jgi:DNA polymerase elongation subunit (family B)
MINSRTVTIDIETLPIEETAFSQSQEANNKTEDRLKTALSGDFGRILCIGYSDERLGNRPSAGVLGWNSETERFSLDEPQMLTDFWHLMRGFNPSRDRIVGHNIFDFDLRFILKRSRRYGIKPSVDLSFARYRNHPIYDLMCEWECWAFGAKVSLDRLAQIFSLPTSKTGEINGSRVFELFEQERYREIRDYCLRDVKLTRAIYQRMTFAEVSAERKGIVMSGTTPSELGLSA